MKATRHSIPFGPLRLGIGQLPPAPRTERCRDRASRGVLFVLEQPGDVDVGSIVIRSTAQR